MTMTCNEVKESTVAYLELDLEASLVRDITAHLEGCAGCRNEMEAVRQVLVRLKRQTVPDPGDQFWEEFPDQVRRQLAQAQGNATPLKRPLSRLRTRSGASMRSWSVALAASVMLLVGAWFLTNLRDEGVVRMEQPQEQSVAKAPIERPPSLEPDLSNLVESHWEVFGDEDPDTVLVDMAAQLDQRTVDRLFGEL